MSALICDGKVAEDSWQWIEGGVPRVAERLEAGEPLVMPLAVWLTHRARLDPRCVGVWLGPDDPLEALLPCLADIPLVAIRFPLFTDGRGYSLARLLRCRYGYTGELRAVGDVLVDQLAVMAQCGFDSFGLRADQPPAEALAALVGGLRSPWPVIAMP